MWSSTPNESQNIRHLHTIAVGVVLRIRQSTLNSISHSCLCEISFSQQSPSVNMHLWRWHCSLLSSPRKALPVCWLTNFPLFSISGDTFYWLPLILSRPIVLQQNSMLCVHVPLLLPLHGDAGRQQQQRRANRIYISNNYIVPIPPNVSNCQFISAVVSLYAFAAHTPVLRTAASIERPATNECLPVPASTL